MALGFPLFVGPCFLVFSLFLRWFFLLGPLRWFFPSFPTSAAGTGVLFGCFGGRMEGDSWFTWWLNHLYQGNPSICPERTPMAAGIFRRAACPSRRKKSREAELTFRRARRPIRPLISAGALGMECFNGPMLLVLFVVVFLFFSCNKNIKIEINR